uniref:Uncharacterized protein n=1 Tax=Amphimedon queenslandica TaxID=400682 RepID=A0A1X7T7I6_AMPQE
MTEVFSELSVIGDNISYEDCVVYVLASLPESFDMLVTAFEANSDVPNLDAGIEKLQHEERKQTERKAVNKTEEGLTANIKLGEVLNVITAKSLDIFNVSVRKGRRL